VVGSTLERSHPQRQALRPRSATWKAGVTANIFAVQVASDLGLQPGRDVLVESVIGEESGGVGTLTTIVKDSRRTAIITEPTRLHLCPVQSGALSFRVRVAGRAIHACIETLRRQRHGEVLSRAAGSAGPRAQAPRRIPQSALRRFEQYRTREFRTIRAGDWPSTVPDELVAEGRFGVLPGTGQAAARRNGPGTRAGKRPR